MHSHCGENNGMLAPDAHRVPISARARSAVCINVYGLLLLCACTVALADSYKCGSQISDHEFVPCQGNQFKLLNGAWVQVPQALTPAEIKTKAEADRRAAIKAAADEAARRQDWQLLDKYPDEAALLRYRERSLEPLRAVIRRSQEALASLAKDRVHLTEQDEFHPGGKGRPQWLQDGLDANDARVLAEKSLMQKAGDDAKEINVQYDAQLVHLKTLWAGPPR
jgi:hypothetical protein